MIKAEVGRLRLRPRLDSRRGSPEHRKDVWPRRREGQASGLLHSSQLGGCSSSCPDEQVSANTGNRVGQWMLVPRDRRRRWTLSRYWNICLTATPSLRTEAAGGRSEPTEIYLLYMRWRRSRRGGNGRGRGRNKGPITARANNGVDDDGSPGQPSAEKDELPSPNLLHMTPNLRERRRLG